MECKTSDGSESSENEYFISLNRLCIKCCDRRKYGDDEMAKMASKTIAAQVTIKKKQAIHLLYEHSIKQVKTILRAMCCITYNKYSDAILRSTIESSANAISRVIAKLSHQITAEIEQHFDPNGNQRNKCKHQIGTDKEINKLKTQLDLALQLIVINDHGLTLFVEPYIREKKKKRGVDIVTLLSGAPEWFSPGFKQQLKKRLTTIFISFFEDLSEQCKFLTSKARYERLMPYFEYIQMYQQSGCLELIEKTDRVLVDKILNCEKMTQIVIKHLTKQQAVILEPEFPLIENNVFSSMKARIEFYEKIKNILANLRESDKLSKCTNIDMISRMYKPCLNTISKCINNAIKSIADQFNLSIMTEDSFTMINNVFNNLQAMSNVQLLENDEYDSKLDANIDSIREKIAMKLNEIGKRCPKKGKNDTISKMSRFLIKLQMGKHHLSDPQFKRIMDGFIIKCLDKCAKDRVIFRLSKALTDESSLTDIEIIWGREIVNTQPILSGAALQLWNSKMVQKSGHGIDDILREMFVHFDDKTKSDHDFQSILKKGYLNFDKEYQKMVARAIINGTLL